MTIFVEKKKKFICFNRFLSALIAFAFGINVAIPPAFAQSISTLLNLPTPGTMVTTTPSFAPVLIKGVNIHPDNALKFDFIIDKGDSKLEGEAFNKEATKLIKYFLAALTIPEDQMWVNLSPYEKDRIVPQVFGQTEMGRDLLVQDYLLKQLTASLMYPDKQLGNEFWKRVHQKAKERFGTEEVPMNTFNKIWIVPEKSMVYEHEKGAFVVKSHLKVMLEEDYLALEANKKSTKHGLGDVKKEDLKVISGVQSEVIKEILIPEIEKEVNEGKTFSSLRQIFNSVILASWYKQALKESLLGKVYVDQGKTKGIENEDKEINQKIYNQYVEAFKKGVYDYIKEDYDSKTQEIIPRQYFSGGIEVDMASLSTQKVLTPPDLTMKDSEVVTTEFRIPDDVIMTSEVARQFEVMIGFSASVQEEMREVIEDFVQGKPGVKTDHAMLSATKDMIDAIKEISPQQLENIVNQSSIIPENQKASIIELMQAIGSLSSDEEQELIDLLTEKGYTRDDFEKAVDKLVGIVAKNQPIEMVTVSQKARKLAHLDSVLISMLATAILADLYIKPLMSPEYDFSWGWIEITKVAFVLLNAVPGVRGIWSWLVTGNSKTLTKDDIRSMAQNFLKKRGEKSSVNGSSRERAESALTEELMTWLKDEKWIRGVDLKTVSDEVLKSFRLVQEGQGSYRVEIPNVGGIDMNPIIMQREIQKNGNGVIIPISPVPVENFKVDGLMPVIINVTPVTNVMFLLGIADQDPNKKSTEVSYNLSSSPMDLRKEYKDKELD